MMIHQPYFILQVLENGTWHGIQFYLDSAQAKKGLSLAQTEDTGAEYRLSDRSYESPGPPA